MSPSFGVSFSVILGQGDREGLDGTFTVSLGPPLDGAASEVGFGAEGSPDVVSKLEGCEQGDERI